jgi:hypothetical protein
MMPSVRSAGCIISVCLLLAGSSARAHSGPPFPIVSSRTTGPYVIAIWTDPDASDDGSAAGQFWITVRAGEEGRALAADTQVTVTIHARDRAAAPHAGVAAPIDGDPTRRFVALLMDHEGPYSVRTIVDGPMGLAVVDADVEATYDLRPPPIMLAIYLAPFLAVGVLWLKLLLRRRQPMPHA